MVRAVALNRCNGWFRVCLRILCSALSYGAGWLAAYDISPKSEPALERHSRAAKVWRHITVSTRKKFHRKADKIKKKIENGPQKVFRPAFW